MLSAHGVIGLFGCCIAEVEHFSAVAVATRAMELSNRIILTETNMSV